jgi:FecR protein
MKRRAGLAAAVYALLAVIGPPAASADDKQLQNVKGNVSYQVPPKAPVPIGVSAIVGISDESYAITGAESLGEVILPDSSQVLVGSQSKVQLAFFNQTQIANAKFVLYDGRIRFAVRHPKGAKANYTFSTPTASVAVRGTQGDIEQDPGGTLRVNVYEVCDPAAPVRITTRNGAVYTVVAGQSFAAQIVNGIVHAEIQQLTQQLIDQFSPEFGVPTSWDAAKGEIIAYAGGQAAGAINNVVPGIGESVVSGLGGLFKKKSSPKPSAVPSPATCS